MLAAIPDMSVNEGELFTFPVMATDPDTPADRLIYTLVMAPSGAQINSDTGVISWNPTEAQGPVPVNTSTISLTPRARS